MEVVMKFSIKNFALTCGIFWGLAILIVSTSNLIWPGYGAVFLTVVASVYPGYEAMQGVNSVIIGTLYAIVDGSIGGALFAWLYNCLPD
jgi:hypothetical protein